jgi:hypothetical protein
MDLKEEEPGIALDTECPKCGAKAGEEHHDGCPDEVIT